MEGIVVKEYTQYREPEILSLYQSVGWGAWYSPETLRQAFGNSLYILGAYVQDRLVGLIRVVGDGAAVIFIQDILVRPAYQRRGIGRKLIAQLFERYRHVRQIHLLTDDLPETTAFYQAVGFLPAEKVHYRAFSRQRF